MSAVMFDVIDPALSSDDVAAGRRDALGDVDVRRRPAILSAIFPTLLGDLAMQLMLSSEFAFVWFVGICVWEGGLYTLP